MADSRSAHRMPKPKRKSPSKRRRDAERAELFKEFIKQQREAKAAWVVKTRDARTQTEYPPPTVDPPSWRDDSSLTTEPMKGHPVAPVAGSLQSSEVTSSTSDQNGAPAAHHQGASPHEWWTAVDPKRVYPNLELAMQLMHLEQPTTMMVALRHVVRVGHKLGRSVTFPSMEAVDRMHLRSMTLPTDFGPLQSLIEKVFARRGEVYSLEEIFNQAVICHGRLLFIKERPFPECYQHTHFPPEHLDYIKYA